MDFPGSDRCIRNTRTISWALQVPLASVKVTVYDSVTRKRLNIDETTADQKEHKGPTQSKPKNIAVIPLTQKTQNAGLVLMLHYVSFDTQQEVVAAHFIADMIFMKQNKQNCRTTCHAMGACS